MSLSQFYGLIRGRGATEATRLGTRDSGLTVTALARSGGIIVHLMHNSKTGEDEYLIAHVENYKTGQGIKTDIARGIIGSEPY